MLKSHEEAVIWFMQKENYERVHTRAKDMINILSKKFKNVKEPTFLFTIDMLSDDFVVTGLTYMRAGTTLMGDGIMKGRTDGAQDRISISLNGCYDYLDVLVLGEYPITEQMFEDVLIFTCTHELIHYYQGETGAVDLDDFTKVNDEFLKEALKKIIDKEDPKQRHDFYGLYLEMMCIQECVSLCDDNKFGNLSEIIKLFSMVGLASIIYKGDEYSTVLNNFRDTYRKLYNN